MPLPIPELTDVFGPSLDQIAANPTTRDALAAVLIDYVQQMSTIATLAGTIPRRQNLVLKANREMVEKLKQLATVKPAATLPIPPRATS